jgi:hypothetical protein
VFAVLALVGMYASGNPLVNNYDELRAAAVGKCRTVDAGKYQTGFFFNPEGYRSYNAWTADSQWQFPGFALDQRWPVRATPVYSTVTGTCHGQWSPVFIESRLPVKERTQILTRGIRF